MDIQLASQSPRRRELLTQIGVRYKTVSVDVPERLAPGEKPQAYVNRLALSKSEAGLKLNPGTLTLGADTIVCCDKDILEKPKNEDDFVQMMRKLSGRTHQVLTAVALCGTNVQKTACGTTDVTFNELTNGQIEQYWQTGEPRDKAGGYGIQGLGAVLVREIKGSYSNVVGLPLEIVSEMLLDLGIPIWQTYE